MGSGFGKQKVKVLVVGLDNSGKTTILSFLKNNKPTNDIAPTVGFNQDTLIKNSLNYTFIDMSGQNQYRDMWEQYSKDADALIFVIDTADPIRFSIMQNELETLLSYNNIKNSQIPILFYANKIDQKESQDPKFFVDFLKLDSIKDRSWYIVGTNAITGVGLDVGLQWLGAKLIELKKKNKK